VKVALVADAFAMQNGESLALNMLRAGRLEDLEYSLICPVESYLGRVLVSQGVRVVDLPLKKADSPFQVADIISRLWSYVTRERFDIIHAVSPRAARYGLLVSRMSGIPLIYHAFSRRSWGTHFMAGRLSAGVICISKRVASHISLVSSGAVPIQVIYCGVTAERSARSDDDQELRTSWGISPAAKVIGVVARLEPGNKLDRIIRVFSRIRDALKDAVLVIASDSGSAGSRVYRQHLFAMVRNLDLNNRVLFRSFAPPCPQIYRVFDVLAAPTGRDEAVLPILEAMASGVPVVAVRSMVLTEYVEDGTNGILIDTGNEDSFIKAVSSLLQNEKTAARMGKAGREMVLEKHTMHHMVSGLNDFYGTVLKRR